MNVLGTVLLASLLLQEPAESRRCLTEAREAAEAIPRADPARYLVLSGIAQGFAELGDVDAALQAASSQALPPHRTQDLVQVARIRRKRGDAPGAAKALRTAADDALKNGPEFASSSLHDVAKAVAETDPARALELCREGVKLASAQTLPQRKSLGIGAFAAVQAAAGDLDAALATASTVPDPGYRAQALVVIAQGRAEAGDAKGTLRALDGLEPSMDVGPLLTLVTAQARAGDLEGSRQTREKLKGRTTMGDVAFCRGRIEAGDVKGALAAAAAIDGEQARHAVRMTAAHAQLKARDLKGALETLAPVPAEARFPSFLQELARAQAEAKQGEEALKTARSIRDPFARTWALIWAGSAGGDARVLEEARKAADEVPDATGNRATLLVHIAAARAAAGDLPGALEMMKASPDAARAAREIAKARARAGEGAATRTWAAGLGAGAVRASALLGAAEGLIERRDRK